MTTVERGVEVHRLAVAGGVAEIAVEVGEAVSGPLLGGSRFADVAAIATATLTLAPNNPDAHHRLEPHRVTRRLDLLGGWSHDRATTAGEVSRGAA